MSLKNSFTRTRQFLLASFFALMLLPMMAFASSEYKGTETVNINKANAATLAAYLKGIGPNKAESIVKYRRSNGNFKSAADLKNVPGIGDKTYKDVKSKISTSRGKSTPPKGYKLGESSGKSSSSKKKKSSSSSKKTTKSDDSKSAASKTKSSTKKKSSSSKTSKDDKKSSAKTSAKKKSTKKSSSKKSTKKKDSKKKSSKKKASKSKKKK